MNDKRFRLIFNKHRNMLMAVAECAIGARKVASGERAGRTARTNSSCSSCRAAKLRPMAWAVLLSLGCVHFAAAQIVSDPRAGHGPNVTATANGTPLVGVTTPSAAGVSRNQYQQFSVDGRGAILNNATVITQTQLGGYVPGNANLGTSGPARVILNEVTGANPSQLNGYIEVAGQRADVIISNGNGISVNGGGFINANRATLTTGAPVFGGDGTLAAFRVTRGGIQVEGAGFNGTSLDQVDLIARSVEVNGQLWANTANVIAGANEVDYANLGVRLIQGEGAAPTVGIDVANLGGMYANRIRLIGTEAGVGVRNAGTLAAQAGDFSIDGAGRVSLSGTTSSTGALALHGAQGIDNSGSTAAGASLSATGEGDIRNSGALIAGRDVRVAGQSVQSTGTLAAGIDANGNMTQGGDLAVTGALGVGMTGQNLAGSNMSVTGAHISLAGSQTRAASNVALTAQAGILDLAGATVTAGQQLTASTTSLLRSDGAKVSGARIDVSAQQLSNKGGTLYAQHGTALLIRGDADNSGGQVLADAGDLSLSADGLLTNAGGRITNAGTGGTTIRARRIENTGNGAIGGNGVAAIAADQLVNTGGAQLIAGTNLGLHLTRSADNAGGQIHAGQRLTIDGSQVIWRNDGGTISGTSVQLAGSSLSSRQGTVLAKDSLDLGITGDIDNSGGILQGGQYLGIRAAGSIINDGGQVLSVDANSSAVVNGTTVTNTNGGIVGGNGSLSLTADRLANTNGAQLVAGADLALHVSDAGDNSGGQIRAAQALTMDGTGAAWTNDGGTITAGALRLAGGSLSNRQGAIVSDGALSAAIGGDIDNASGTIQAGDTLAIEATGALRNAAGRVVGTSAADATVRAAVVANTNGGLLGGNGAASVTTDQLVNTGGAQLVAGTDLGLHLVQSADNTGGKIYAGQRLTVDGSQVAWRNDGGTISGKSVRFAGASLSNRQGTMLADEELTGSLGGNVDNTGGALQGGTTLDVSAGGTLTNDAGQIVNTGTGQTRVVASSLISTNGAMVGGNGDVQVQARQLANTARAQIVSGGAQLLEVGQSFNNAGGQVYGGTGLTVNGGAAALNNDGGSLASGGDSVVQVASLSNQGGKVIADGDIGIDTHALTGVGTVHSGQDLRLAMQGDYANVAGNLLKAERNLLFGTTGAFTNQGKLEAVNALTINSSRIVNEAGATINSAATTLNATADIANAGRIEGDTVVTNSDVLINTGTVIGREVTGSHREIHNTGAAAIMAATDTLNVYGRELVSNTEGATLYSLGDLNIAANRERDERGYLKNRTGRVLNDSSTIEGGSDYSVVEIAAQELINQRPDPLIISDTTVDTKHQLKREKYIHCATTNAYPQMGCTQELWEGPYKTPVDRTFTAAQILSRDDARQRLVVDINGVASQIDYNTLTESNGVLQVNYWDGYDRDVHYDPGTEYATLSDAQRGWQRVEIARDTTTTTITDRDANPNQPAANLVSGGAMILANVASLTNRYSTIAAGDSMQIGDQSAASGALESGQFGTTTVTNVGQTLYRRTTQDIVSTYAWSKDTTQDVGPVAQPGVVLAPVAVGRISGNITAGQRLAIFGGDVRNEDVGKSDPLAGTGSTGVSGVTVAGVSPIQGSNAGHGGSTGVTGHSVDAQSIAVTTLANAPISLPTNGLYQYHTEPGYTYLIETDPRFTQYGKFLSSDYMLGLLGIDPAMTQKRLGDGFYEQKLIRDQVTRLTGHVTLAGYDSAEEQYKALMASGVHAAQQFNILPGMALTAAQMDALTSDIVWLVSETVTLPDSSTQSVLVPRIYLARAQAADLQANGALIAADDLELHSAGTMENSGIVDAKSRLSIAARDDVVNRGGAIRSQGITAISAGRDILNQSGQISGDKVGLVARRDIQNITLFNQLGVQSAAGNSKASSSLYGEQAGIASQGDMLLSAGRDISATGATIEAGGDAALLAGRNLTFDTLEGKTNQSIHNSAKLHSEDSRTEHAISSVKTGGSLTTSSGGDTTLKGTQVRTGTDLTMVAGGDLKASAVTNETTHDNVARQSKQRQLEEHSRAQSTVGVSLEAGGNATLAAVKPTSQGGGLDRTDGKGNVTLVGTNVKAGADGQGGGTLTVVADRNVTVTEARELDDSSIDIQRKSGSFVSRTSTSEQSSRHSDIGVGSTLSGDTVHVKGGNDVTVRQSAIAATDGVAPHGHARRRPDHRWPEYPRGQRRPAGQEVRRLRICRQGRRRHLGGQERGIGR
ncbi:filamentous hemagglutinin N-terminal domain-containing protein [Cupriavidus nantongensis]|uniref:two-partner secretion domain-containing protein n=1 Tax=Cupriavidus nantongensis TaxID=1796606 RepID=UPI00358FEB91